GAHHGRHFLRAAGAHHGEGLALRAAAPVALVRGEVALDEDVRRPDGGLQLGNEGIHALALRRRTRTCSAQAVKRMTLRAISSSARGTLSPRPRPLARTTPSAK